MNADYRLLPAGVNWQLSFCTTIIRTTTAPKRGKEMSKPKASGHSGPVNYHKRTKDGCRHHHLLPFSLHPHPSVPLVSALFRPVI